MQRSEHSLLSMPGGSTSSCVCHRSEVSFTKIALADECGVGTAY
jgi:hypothetical protein